MATLGLWKVLSLSRCPQWVQQPPTIHGPCTGVLILCFLHGREESALHAGGQANRQL